MKTASVREFRSQMSDMIRGKETVAVTSHGKLTAIVWPVRDPKKIPMEVRRQLYLELSARIARQLQAKGVTEDEIQRDFEDSKKRRRGR